MPIRFDDLGEINHDKVEAIVFRDENRIITQNYKEAKKRKFWDSTVSVYYRSDPPTSNVNPHMVGLPAEPDNYELVVDKVIWPEGEELLRFAKSEMGDHGLIGVFCGTSSLLHNPSDIYQYYDDPKVFYDRRDQLMESLEKRFYKLMSLSVKPDFICTGYSGTLIFQTPEIFRELGLPIVKKVTSLCKKHGIPSHIHSCGPERELVKIAYEETDLTIIDPLEIPPMGDCDLFELKKKYGDKLVLKGNLHTTSIMLSGTVDDVIRASKDAIDAAAENGRFILSTGDQCGRDTPDENIYAMIDTAKTYGKY